MNQLEFFVASTECERWQVRRCLRAIRVLDERIEYILGVLQAITEYRSTHLASSSSAAHPVGTRGGRGGGRKRGRSPANSDAHEGGVDGEETHAETQMSSLKEDFHRYRVTVTRLARERENYAKLLCECGASMNRCAATRLLQFQQIVDNDKKSAM